MKNITLTLTPQQAKNALLVADAALKNRRGGGLAILPEATELVNAIAAARAAVGEPNIPVTPVAKRVK